MSIEELLDKPLASWLAGSGPDSDIVLSSRVRLARNLSGVSFPNKASADEANSVVEQARKVVNDLRAADQAGYVFVEMDKLSPAERNILVEKHIVSPDFAERPAQRAIIVRDDAAVSIMVNEEDHFRIQCLVSGLNLTQAGALADKVDDILESKLDFGFNENVGYLTACPTNVGTGLRASVMMHLPALVITGRINRIMAAATQLGLAVRGLYGEGTETAGNIFQISNQVTLGHGEAEIIANLQGIASQIIEQERLARQLLMSSQATELADRVWRAYGILRYARTISGSEALAMLSEVRLGIDLGIITGAPAEIYNELLVTTRPNFLQKVAGRTDVEAAERDRLRAQLIREKLREGKNDA